jgi:hypothetical protein
MLSELFGSSYKILSEVKFRCRGCKIQIKTTGNVFFNQKQFILLQKVVIWSEKPFFLGLQNFCNIYSAT